MGPNTYTLHFYYFIQEYEIGSRSFKLPTKMIHIRFHTFMRNSLVFY